ncbi:hypothetical protein GH714_018353 [Hevea brasiliensis]|uniref:Uncharacterized protein n=1 Tax=Hevea brasiliensis TaxID=3981 RepID=A0A6A6LPS3_HEVBR|nr:hypothetical protein GH714_018353 [Hevea brasiliensis]
MDSWVQFTVGRDVEDLTLDFSIAEVKYEYELLGTPVLESLKLLSCVGIHRLNLSLNSHLKDLVISGAVISYEEDDTVLEILGPHLKIQEILGFWCKKKWKLMNMSSLIRATLDFQVKEGTHENWNDFLKKC